MRAPLVDYLTFSRKERVGILIILSIIVITAVAPAFFTAPKSDSDTTQLNRLRSQVIMLDKGFADSSQPKFRTEHYPSTERQLLADPDKRPPALFYFDPNTLDINGWQKLGVKERTAATIKKYLSSGGRFKRADDLLKIYGLSDNDKERLLPFVRIIAVEDNSVVVARSGYHTKDVDRPVLQSSAGSGTGRAQNLPPRYTPHKQPHSIEINTADTSEWASLPGIGPVLSLRIVKYRERLGGFYDVLQVAETYGLQDSVFQKIKSYLTCKGGIQQIPLNEVTPDILERHPYLRRQIARAIIDYRVQHGAFKEVADLKQVVVITPELYQRIAPYLRL